MRLKQEKVDHINKIPAHLRRYVVEQDYGRYTPVDQAVWRYILHQLKAFLSEHAHPCYAEGLVKTGISLERIPSIDEISQKIQRFGWMAVPVSGFIPPAAFMELQALGVLPIASDMRSLEHLMYTPAPDIVHEAAGHAPILIEPSFSHYLQKYAEVASHAIINKIDLDIYDAIRTLSDLKEDPHSTPEAVRETELRLEKLSKASGDPSEAALLARMNWWTAEYGLIGNLEKPRIYGAGLLSSVGEAKKCLGPEVNKIPFNLDCINFSYDITEPQPQLFVTPSFDRLIEVLEELANQMSFRRGGLHGLARAKHAETVNTVELDSGLTISGVLSDFLLVEGEPAYLSFLGPSQLCHQNREFPGHGKAYHREGFGSPVGRLKKPQKLDFKAGTSQVLEFQSGVTVRGTYKSSLVVGGKPLIITFEGCQVTWGDRLLFDPSWGTYDMAVGQSVVSVYGGAADREAFGEADHFARKIIPRRAYSHEELRTHQIYQRLRDLRANALSDAAVNRSLEEIYRDLVKDWPTEGLLWLELHEITLKTTSAPEIKSQISNHLHQLMHSSSHSLATLIREGLEVMDSI